MHKHIILIRHSVPDIRPELSSNQWTLNQLGRHRAHCLARQLVFLGLDNVVSSLEPKASKTAQIIADHCNLSVQCFPGLHEHKRENEPFTSETEFRNNVSRLLSQPEKLTFGQETADDAHRRFKEAVDRLFEVYTNQNLAIVTHGTVMSLYVARLLGVDPMHIWLGLGLPSAMIFSKSDLAFKARFRPI